MVAHGTTPLEAVRKKIAASREANRLRCDLPPARVRDLYTALPSLKKDLAVENARRVVELTERADLHRNGEFERMEALRNQLLADKRAELESSFAAKLARVGSAEAELRQKLLADIEALRAEFSAKLTALPTPASAHEKATDFARLPEVVPAPPVTAPSLLDWFKGNWRADTVYRAGDIIAFRGSCYLVLQDVRGEFPTNANQKQPGALYAVIAAAGAPGPMAPPTINPASKIVPAGDYTITSLDSFLVANNSAAATWTLYAPTNTSAFVRFKNRGTANLTISGTIFAAEAVSSLVLVTGDMVTLRADGTYWNVCD
jgi:hypothetical protein